MRPPQGNIRKVTYGPIKYLVNTHHHGDHVGGNPLFVGRSVIIAHHDVRKWMIEVAREENSENKIEEIAAPHVTYSKEIQIHLGGKAIRIFHVANGHTSGDSIIYLPHFVVRGEFHLGTEDRFHDALDAWRGQFQPVTSATLYPLDEIQGSVRKTHDLMIVNTSAIQLYHPERQS